jgi:hypothetical protein
MTHVMLLEEQPLRIVGMLEIYVTNIELLLLASVCRYLSIMTLNVLYGCRYIFVSLLRPQIKYLEQFLCYLFLNLVHNIIIVAHSQGFGFGGGVLAVTRSTSHAN